jgi:hypothetical protein
VIAANEAQPVDAFARRERFVLLQHFQVRSSSGLR